MEADKVDTGVSGDEMDVALPSSPVEDSMEDSIEGCPLEAAPGTSDSGIGRDDSDITDDASEISYVGNANAEVAQVAQATGSDILCPGSEMVDFKIKFNKQMYDICMTLDSTIEVLKNGVELIIGVPASMQKVIFKGLAKDHQTLRDLNVTNGAKMMVVGSTLGDIESMSVPVVEEVKEPPKLGLDIEPLCQCKSHRKVLEEFGKPEDTAPGIKDVKESLPPTPLTGMYNRFGTKVRLTFKLGADQLWISTREKTEMVQMATIPKIYSEPILGHEEYHVVGFQMKTMEDAVYWVYWVPSQYVQAMRDVVLKE